jgi:uncharacterized Zn finger protein (UPF0148 family)
MPEIECVVCGVVFHVRTHGKTCSPACKRTRKLELAQAAHRKKQKTEANKVYREAHKEKAAAYQKEWNKRNSERLKRKKRENYLQNIEAIQQKNKAYREANKEALKKTGALYRGKNKILISEKARERYVANKNKYIRRAIHYYWLQEKGIELTEEMVETIALCKELKALIKEIKD